MPDQQSKGRIKRRRTLIMRQDLSLLLFFRFRVLYPINCTELRDVLCYSFVHTRIAFSVSPALVKNGNLYWQPRRAVDLAVMVEGL
jgi:hypothetical protein